LPSEETEKFLHALNQYGLLATTRQTGRKRETHR